MKVKLIAVTKRVEIPEGESDDLETNVVVIARASSSRQDKTEKIEGLIKYLIDHKHWSPFEHSYITFEIVTSKSIAIQLLRHVSCRFQEFSQRYARVDFIEDTEFRIQADKNRQSSTLVIGGTQQKMKDDTFFVWYQSYSELDEEFALHIKRTEWLDRVGKHFEDSLKLYQDGLDIGIAKESARFVLPMATQTTLYMTGSIRSWIHILEQRTDEHAQKEIRLVAAEIEKIFIKQAPRISKALGLDLKYVQYGKV